MKDATRDAIWSILTREFEAILDLLHATVPQARMSTGHSHNEAFPFRAYAEYFCGEKPTVVLSFDVQLKDSLLYICGDLSQESGYVLRTFIETESAPETVGEEWLVAHAREFAVKCGRSSNLIASELLR